MDWLESSVFAEAKSDLLESSVFADTLSHIRSSLLCSQIRYLAYLFKKGSCQLLTKVCARSTG